MPRRNWRGLRIRGVSRKKDKRKLDYLTVLRYYSSDREQMEIDQVANRYKIEVREIFGRQRVIYRTGSDNYDDAVDMVNRLENRHGEEFSIELKDTVPTKKYSTT
jgi:hypothetical protein